MIDERLKKFFQGLIQAGHETPLGNFKQVSVRLLRGLIHFDMAIWASGNAEELRVHNVYLYKFPRSVVNSWEQSNHLDKISEKIVANPGKTVDVVEFYSRQERAVMEKYILHSRLFGVEAAITTAIPDPDTGLFEVLSLCRGSAASDFSPQDRKLKQDLFPFMVQVWHYHQLRQLRSVYNHKPGKAMAICDSHGWLRRAEPQFAKLLKTEFPKWQGPVLPEGLRRWLAEREQSEFVGRLVRFNRDRQTEWTILQASSRGPLALLTPREEEIAQAYAAGSTYRVIAEELSVSPSTVRRHLESVYRKLQIKNKTELVQMIG